MKNTFGLDIGATSIKAVWMDKENKNYILNSVFSAPTPPKGLVSENPLDQQELAKAIMEVVKSGNIKAKKVNLALTERQVFSRVIEMPNLSEKELASAIVYEAEQYIPIPIDQITLDYKVLQRPSNTDQNQKMIVLLIGAPNTIISKYENIISSAGLELVSMETEILSIIRVLVVGENFPVSIILNIGSTSSSMAIVKNSNLIFIYSIPIGGTALTRAIAADFGFSALQAEEYKKTYGIVKDNFSGKIGRAAFPILSSLSLEIKKAIAFYKGKYLSSDPISQIILSGGSARLPGLDAYFTADCGIETVVANPWKILKNEKLPAEIVDEGSIYTVAVGLAMREDE